MKIPDEVDEVMSKVKRSWCSRLFDMDDNSVSSTTLFMFVLTVIGCILLLVPAITLLIEIFYNHTITTDLSGMAAYIGSVTALFTAAGLTKAWSNWANMKYKDKNKKPSDEGDSEPDCENFDEKSDC